MSELRDLYQEVILDHYKKPRNFRKPEDANRHADGHNPLCGDKISVYLKMEDGLVKDIGFQGSGCAISTASASMMTERLKGKSEAEADAVFEKFHHLLTAEDEANGESPEPELGKLAVFSGVKEFPVRVKCATLAWHTLKAAMKNQAATVSTE